jgi:cyclopropane fatty-acyl-phospholipid synthase-like methyltransferase
MAVRAMSTLPFSEACERNKDPILEKLREHFAAATRVLEIGSGTGQHALHFAAALPQLAWQTSEVPGQLDAVRAWLAARGLPNVLAPIELDVRGEWPAGSFDAIFSANTLHIMGWDGVCALFRGVARCLAPGGVLAIYGPFNYGGRHTSDSNAAFDDLLRRRDPASGIRDREAVEELARAAGLAPVADHAMPANNRLLVWARAP